MATKKKAVKKQAVRKTKPAARKKTPVKKAGARKKAAQAAPATRPGRARPAERPPLVNTLGRRTSNRVALRRADAGRPPEGALDRAAVDAAVLAWMALPGKQPSDYAQYPLDRLLADAREMAAGREDLPLFAELETPITARDFDWLDQLLAEMERLGDDQRVNEADREVLSEDAQIAIRDVMAARTALSNWAQAVGIPLSLFAVERGFTDPYALFNAAARGTRMFRLYLDQMGGVTQPSRLLANMDAALGRLAPLVGVSESVEVDSKATRSRRAAVKRLLLDCLLYIAPWGRAVVGADPVKAGRYELDKLFPRRGAAPSNASAATLDTPA
ncbi:MAG: hypothetical protein AB2A00_16360 [Myxococcota bacterium]